MTIEEEFGDWMQTIQVEPFGGDGAWGESFGAPSPVLAFWQYENRVLISSDGKSVTSSTQLSCATSYAGVLKEGARVTLPLDTRKYRVVSVRTWPGDDSQLEVGLV